jgi:hypothetical protein
VKVVALLSSGKLTPLEKRDKVERLVKTEVKENSVSIKREGGIFEAEVMSEPSVKIKSERIGGGISLYAERCKRRRGGTAEQSVVLY